MSTFDPGPGWHQIPNRLHEPEKERLYHWVGTDLTCWAKDDEEDAS